MVFILEVMKAEMEKWKQGYRCSYWCYILLVYHVHILSTSVTISPQ